MLWSFLLLVAVLATIYTAYPKHKKKVSGQTVLITGAASGIGKLMALRFARLGARVVCWDIAKAACEETAAECEKAGAAQAKAYVVDISNFEVVQAAAKQVEKDFGTVDILVNNAGIVSGKLVHELNPRDVTKTFEVNVFGIFWALQAFLPKMYEQNAGHVVTIASLAGVQGAPKLVDYCASKFAAYGAMDSLRAEIRRLGKTGVKTTVVCPFYINTGMFDGAKSKSPLLPILDPDYVADSIVAAILTDTPELYLPLIGKLAFVGRLLPVGLRDFIDGFLGVGSSMDDFSGRREAART